MLSTVRAARRNCPCSGRPSTSSDTDCVRSPFATAPMTRAISIVGRTRSSISALTEFSSVSQEPDTAPSDTRWLILPSMPTARLMRSNSCASFALCSITSFSVSAILPAVPVQCTGSRTEKSPFLSATRHSSSAAASTTS